MRKWFQKKSNIILLIVIAMAIYVQAPLILNNAGHVGKELETKKYAVFQKTGKSSMEFPLSNSHSLVIFWATWCGPCKLEMNRLKSSVDEGKIPPGKIFAINPFENAMIVEKFVEKTDLPFTFIDAMDIVNKLEIQATPTTIFLEGNKIHSMKSGISLIGIWNAESFLSN